MNCSKFKNKQLLNKNNLICISRKWVSNVVKYLVGMRYLFIWFCLEFVDFLQFWNFECSMSITAFSLQIVDLSITLLDLHLHVPFLLEHGTALLIKFHAQSRQVICKIAMFKYKIYCCLREAFKKKNCVFCDIGPKGGWVPVSKHNFFYIRNYVILYQRWVGVKHRCHNFTYP